MEGLKLDKRVWLCEDGSGIVEKVEFDLQTNQMVGLLLPLDSKTGMPIAYTYLARNAKEIEINMQKKSQRMCT